jgi:hypothetical protein
MKQQTLHHRLQAARVAQQVTPYGVIELLDRWRHLAEIHVAPQWLWAPLVKALHEHSWTVEATRKAVESLKKLDDPPAWVNLEQVTAVQCPLIVYTDVNGLLCKAFEATQAQNP